MQSNESNGLLPRAGVRVHHTTGKHRLQGRPLLSTKSTLHSDLS